MVGVWMAPVTAQVMMTLFDVAMFDVAMFEASLDSSCDPPRRPNRADANLQIYDFAAFSYPAREGRKAKCATALGRST